MDTHLTDSMGVSFLSSFREDMDLDNGTSEASKAVPGLP